MRGAGLMMMMMMRREIMKKTMMTTMRMTTTLARARDPDHTRRQSQSRDSAQFNSFLFGARWMAASNAYPASQYSNLSISQMGDSGRNEATGARSLAALQASNYPFRGYNGRRLSCGGGGGDNNARHGNWQHNTARRRAMTAACTHALKRKRNELL